MRSLTERYEITYVRAAQKEFEMHIVGSASWSPPNAWQSSPSSILDYISCPYASRTRLTESHFLLPATAILHSRSTLFRTCRILPYWAKPDWTTPTYGEGLEDGCSSSDHGVKPEIYFVRLRLYICGIWRKPIVVDSVRH